MLHPWRFRRPRFAGRSPECWGSTSASARNRPPPRLGHVPSCNSPKWNCAGEPRKHGWDIQNQYDGSIAENRGAADQITGNYVAREGLDDELFFADQLIR